MSRDEHRDRGVAKFHAGEHFAPEFPGIMDLLALPSFHIHIHLVLNVSGANLCSTDSCCTWWCLYIPAVLLLSLLSLSPCEDCVVYHKRTLLPDVPHQSQS